MKTILKILLLLIFISSCQTQKEVITLSNGKKVSKKKLDKMTKKAFKDAHKTAINHVGEYLSKKQIKNFEKGLNNTIVVLDTINK